MRARSLQSPLALALFVLTAPSSPSVSAADPPIAALSSDPIPGLVATASPSPPRLAQFHTPLGEILVELYPDDKPITVENFRAYVASGRFKDSFVQRWDPGFVIQGGGFFITNRGTASPSFASVNTDPPILNEYGVGHTFSNTYGTIAMARVGGQTNSATSQWFFNLGDNRGLDGVDGGFTVFGRTLLGTNVLNRFNNVSLTNGIFLLDLGGALAELPVLSNRPTYEDLVYTDISLPLWPRLAITRDSQGNVVLSWNSLSNFVHHLEYTASFPPAWQHLYQTNGTGQTLALTLPASGPVVPTRFYRLRLE